MNIVKCKDCNKKFINQGFLDKHIEKEHPSYNEPKSKGWATPYGFIDFSAPVTYDEACEVMKGFQNDT